MIPAQKNRKPFCGGFFGGISQRGGPADHRLGITESLWAAGTYVSANDVLHVGMVAWLAVTAGALGPALRDRTP